jgi:methyl-accepting chemotaxis protein
MGKNHEALIAQERILTSLENMDLTEFAKANVIILKELQLTTEKFAHFNQYLQNIGTLMEDSKNFAYKINELINRTDNFTTVSQKVMEVFEENKELQKFLQHHYSSLDQSHQLISSAVDKVSDTLNQSLDKLKDFTQEKISEVQQITLREIDLLQNEYPEKWKKLDQLTHLEELSKNIKDMKYSVASQSGTLNNEVKEINSTMTKMLSVAESQNRKESNSIWTRIKGVFKKKKKVTVDEE